MGLKEYRAKRNFGRTAEPRGEVRKGRKGPLTFVVQKHAASRLHYDFRLELDGVLKSWAVPKGPSLDPGTKRLAMHVEDHPLEYGDFEGVIPKGEYGGGTVMVWDRGHWYPERDARQDYERGRLKFRLEGEKLRGTWNLVKMGGRDREENSWLLIKERDDEARPGDGDDVTEERDESVLTGRTIREIARDRDRVWSSTEGEIEAEPAADPSGLMGAKKAAALPADVEPQLAQLGKQAPAGDEWVHEMKLDGYRILIRIDNDDVKLLSRTGKDWTARFEEIAEAAGRLRCSSALLDGELVVLDERGISSFQALQKALGAGRSGRQLHWYGFDVLFLDGWDVRAAPLVERKELLANLLGAGEGALRYSGHVEGRGPEFHAQACRMGLEGTISKLAAAPYRSGRSGDWRKTKCTLRQEFVIIGYTDPKGSRHGFGALLLGVHDEQGRLVHAGRVGTGFTGRTIDALYPELKRRERKSAPIDDPPRGAAARDIHWVEPELVAEVAFAEWTHDGVIRHPSFQGLREDKRPEEIVREKPAETTGAGKAGSGRKDGAKREPASGPAEIAGIRLSSPDRVFWPEANVTKLDLARYYEAVADRVLPHLEGRPLTLVRCPSGHEDCFYQKHAKDGIPEAVGRVEIPEEDGTAEYMYVRDLSSVIALVQLGVLEFHVWGSRTDRLDRPDRLIFDLDPDPDLRWTEVVAAALLLRQRLKDLGLQSFVKTTGGKGLHVMFPIDRRTTWDDGKAFTQAIAAEFTRTWPHRFTDIMSKRRRTDRIYIDFHRNAFNATAVAAYSTRARPGAPVSVPLFWDELAETKKLPVWTLKDVPSRVREQSTDPWVDVTSVRQSLTRAMLRSVIG